MDLFERLRSRGATLVAILMLLFVSEARSFSSLRSTKYVASHLILPPHTRYSSSLMMSIGSDSQLESLRSLMTAGLESFRRARSDGFGTKARNAAVNATEGDVIVPLCSNLEMRQSLANRGVYPGVEYKVVALTLGCGEKVLSLEGLNSDAKSEAYAFVRPAYPLRRDLERDDWPVRVLLDEVPLWISKGTYEAGTAVGTLALSLSVVAQAALVAFFFRFVGVPSPSMMPALVPGNVVLVTRSFPVGPFKPKVGDVVFFNAPKELESAVAQLQVDGGSEIGSVKGKQFLKRVLAVPGEDVGVKRSEPYVQKASKFRFDVVGPYVRPDLFKEQSWERKPSMLGSNEYFVAGDNGYRSVDSRVWGALKERYIVGTAKWVLWPLKDFGPVKPGQIIEIEKPSLP